MKNHPQQNKNKKTTETPTLEKNTTCSNLFSNGTSIRAFFLLWFCMAIKKMPELARLSTYRKPEVRARKQTPETAWSLSLSLPVVVQGLWSGALPCFHHFYFLTNCALFTASSPHIPLGFLFLTRTNYLAWRYSPLIFQKPAWYWSWPVQYRTL